jgi:hypothetical protein
VRWLKEIYALAKVRAEFSCGASANVGVVAVNFGAAGGKFVPALGGYFCQRQITLSAYLSYLFAF